MKNLFKLVTAVACAVAVAIAVSQPVRAQGRTAWAGPATNLTAVSSTDASNTVVVVPIVSGTHQRVSVSFYNYHTNALLVNLSGSFPTNTPLVGDVRVPAATSLVIQLGEGYNGAISTRYNGAAGTFSYSSWGN